jgi:hypothetical protein
VDKVRVFTLNDIQRAYFAVELPRLMWEHFESDLEARAKETRTTGKRSQLNHFKGHVRQLVEDGEMGYQGRELEWIVLCEAMHRGWPTTKAMLKDGTVVEVPADPHHEVEKKDFGVLIDILHEIAFDNDVILKEYNDDSTTRSKDEDPPPAPAGEVSDSEEQGSLGVSGGTSPLTSSQPRDEPQEVPVAYRLPLESGGGEPQVSYGERVVDPDREMVSRRS